jgi:Cys-tRNA(Pro)/Cys-tRNA(Cys) deacylase
MTKTNAVRYLESRGIPFTIHEYEVNVDDLSGASVAQKIDADADSVFKTLVARSDKDEIFVYCIPVTAELDLKKGAKAAGQKKIEMLKVSELLEKTGYIRGGCSPIGMKKTFPTFLEESAFLFEEIYISAGARGMQLKMAPQILQNVTGAILSDLV